MSKEQLENDLKSLRNAVKTQLNQPRPRKTTLEIINKPTEETYWEQLLTYFIDPSEPHGFGTDVLEAFLQALSEAPESTIPQFTTGLEEIRLQTQVTADDGQPDILLWREEDWFILIEMKVCSGESDDQTERYSSSHKFGPVEVGNYAETDSHYIYLREPSGKAPVAVETFEQVGWDHVVDYLEAVVTEKMEKYPAKSRLQYIDFLDTIKKQFNMTEYDSEPYERAALAIKYEDTINTVTNGLEELQNKEMSRWQTDFHDTLDEVQSSWRTTDYGSRLVVFDEDWIADRETLTLDSEYGDIVAGYITKYDTDSIKRRQLQLNFKIFRKWVDNPFANKIDSYFHDQREQLRPYIEQDINMRLRDDTKSALFVRDVEYDITESHSVGERLARVILETNGDLHETVSVLLEESLDSIQE